MNDTQYLHFSIHGDFITNLARERFYQNNEIEHAFQLLLSSTETDQVSYEERLGTCIQILDGKAEITGVYPDNNYGLQPTPDNPSLGFFQHLKEITEKLQQKERELDIAYRKMCYLLQEADLTSYELNRIESAYYQEYQEHFFSEKSLQTPYSNETLQALDQYNKNTPVNSMLESYLSHNKNYRDDDYGWLAPDGTYYPVEWGNHSQWARDYTEEHYPFKDYAHMYWKTDENENRHHYVNGDFLVYVLHWVLLDNPYQGIATPKYDPAYGMTKKQKEFLYDYYIERDMHDRASEIWDDK